MALPSCFKTTRPPLKERLQAILRRRGVEDLGVTTLSGHIRWNYCDVAYGATELVGFCYCDSDFYLEPLQMQTIQHLTSNRNFYVIFIAQCPECLTIHYAGYEVDRLERKTMRETRLKEVVIDENLIVAVLNGFNQMQCVTLPVTEELPPGCEVTRVYHDPQIRGFVAQIHHHSFARVAEGAIPPRIDDYLKVDRLELQPMPLRRQQTWLPEAPSWDSKPARIEVTLHDSPREIIAPDLQLETSEVPQPPSASEVEVTPQTPDNKQRESDFFFKS